MHIKEKYFGASKKEMFLVKELSTCYIEDTTHHYLHHLLAIPSNLDSITMSTAQNNERGWGMHREGGRL